MWGVTEGLRCLGGVGVLAQCGQETCEQVNNAVWWILWKGPDADWRKGCASGDCEAQWKVERLTGRLSQCPTCKMPVCWLTEQHLLLNA